MASRDLLLWHQVALYGASIGKCVMAALDAEMSQPVDASCDAGTIWCDGRLFGEIRAKCA